MADISKHYSGVAALTDVSVEVLPGEVHAILGENGAGKSTLMNIATGTTEPDERHDHGLRADGGRARPRSEATSLGHRDRPPAPRRAAGPDGAGEPQVALPAAVFAAGTPTEWRAACLTASGCEVAPRRPGRDADPGREAPARDRQGVRRHAELLVLDEPTAPLGGDAVALLFGLVRDAVAGGHLGRLHHPPARRGARARRPGDGAARRAGARHRDGRRRPPTTSCSRSSSGRRLESTFPTSTSPTPSDRANLRPRRTSPGPASRRCPSRPRRGEIIGIAGVVGNGQTELLRALAGLEPFTGTVAVGGHDADAGRAAAPRRLHAGGPARRGPDDEPVGAGERRTVGAEEVPPRAASSAGAAKSPTCRPHCDRFRSRRRRWTRRSPPCPAATSRRS